MRKTYPHLLTGIVIGRTRILSHSSSSPPWLLETGREEEGRRGKSQDAVDNADAAQFRRMEGVRGLSRRRKTLQNVWKTGPGGVLL